MKTKDSKKNSYAKTSRLQVTDNLTTMKVNFTRGVAFIRVLDCVLDRITYTFIVLVSVPADIQHAPSKYKQDRQAKEHEG